MNILVDENIPYADETFGQHAEVVRFSGRELSASELASVDALIIRSITRVNADLLSLHSPAFIGTCTIGTDHIDTDLLAAKGIKWAHAPGCNAQSVVDYVMSAVAALKGDDFPKTVGIVGCGNVGGLLRKRVLEIGSTLSVYDPFLDSAAIPELTSLSATMASELVCLHTPYSELGAYPSRHMIAANELAALPNGAILLSAGRGGVICETELLAFIQQRPDIGLVLDVWQSEPCINPELLRVADIATPHIAGYSVEGKMRGTAQIYAAFCRHFGIQASPPEIVQLAGKSLSAESVADGLLSVYDPKEDARAMRAAFARADADSRHSGSWFDNLRKHYPNRYEIASYQIASNQRYKNQLKTRGFAQT